MAADAAIVVGVGAEEGLGAALCRRVARGGLHVIVGGRTQVRLGAVVATICAAGGVATAAPSDTTREEDVKGLFDLAERLTGRVPAVVAYNAGNNAFVDFRETTAALFEDMW